MRIAPPPPPVKNGEEATMKGKIKLPGYYSENLQIYMFATYNNTEYRFVMNFDKPKLYRKVRSFVFNNHKRKILVFGTWYSDSLNSFCTRITSETQVTAED